MSDENDFLAEMGKDDVTEKNTKNQVNKITNKNAGKIPGPPPSQKTPYGPAEKGGKDKGDKK